MYLSPLRLVLLCRKNTSFLSQVFQRLLSPAPFQHMTSCHTTTITMFIFHSIFMTPITYISGTLFRLLTPAQNEIKCNETHSYQTQSGPLEYSLVLWDSSPIPPPAFVILHPSLPPLSQALPLACFC